MIIIINNTDVIRSLVSAAASLVSESTGAWLSELLRSSCYDGCLSIHCAIGSLSSRRASYVLNRLLSFHHALCRGVLRSGSYLSFIARRTGMFRNVPTSYRRAIIFDCP